MKLYQAMHESFPDGAWAISTHTTRAAAYRAARESFERAWTAQTKGYKALSGKLRGLRRGQKALPYDRWRVQTIQVDVPDEMLMQLALSALQEQRQGILNSVADIRTPSGQVQCRESWTHGVDQAYITLERHFKQLNGS
ncbi:hypothetical protein [Neptuniibacter sp. QD37_11]|uniref:hypothetical protein n=1 Tax=Neptuniibacter sp. QD37_11 TaxID=3398209 RepID=UPI0039F46B2A